MSNKNIEAMVEMNDQLVTVVANYKAKLLDAGFGGDVAEAMTVAYHAELVQAVLGQVATGAR
jgi:hypothetical protein